MYGSVIAELDSNQLLVGAASRHAFETQIRELQKQVSCPRASLLMQFRLIWRVSASQAEIHAFRAVIVAKSRRHARKLRGRGQTRVLKFLKTRSCTPPTVPPAHAKAGSHEGDAAGAK